MRDFFDLSKLNIKISLHFKDSHNQSFEIQKISKRQMLLKKPVKNLEQMPTITLWLKNSPHNTWCSFTLKKVTLDADAQTLSFESSEQAEFERLFHLARLSGQWVNKGALSL